MTVIAYRDGILAGDSEVSEDGINVAGMTKVAKTPHGWLVGAAGPIVDIAAYLRWASKCFKARSKPRKAPTDEFLGIAISPDGKAFFYEACWDAYSVEGDYHAIGSGSIPALIAMDLGASAEGACKAACKRVHGCSEPVVTVSLSRP